MLPSSAPTIAHNFWFLPHSSVSSQHLYKGTFLAHSRLKVPTERQIRVALVERYDPSDTTRTASEIGMSFNDEVDGWVSQLMGCKPLSETEVKKLCEKVSRGGDALRSRGKVLFETLSP